MKHCLAQMIAEKCATVSTERRAADKSAYQQVDEPSEEDREVRQITVIKTLDHSVIIQAAYVYLRTSTAPDREGLPPCTPEEIAVSKDKNASLVPCMLAGSAQMALPTLAEQVASLTLSSWRGWPHWKRRWAVLRRHALSFYKDDREYELKASIPLSHIAAVTLIDNESINKNTVHGNAPPQTPPHIRAQNGHNAVLKDSLDSKSVLKLTCNHGVHLYVRIIPLTDICKFQAALQKSRVTKSSCSRSKSMINRKSMPRSSLKSVTPSAHFDGLTSSNYCHCCDRGRIPSQFQHMPEECLRAWEWQESIQNMLSNTNES
jgi:PH domain